MLSHSLTEVFPSSPHFPSFSSTDPQHPGKVMIRTTVEPLMERGRGRNTIKVGKVKHSKPSILVEKLAYKTTPAIKLVPIKT